MTEIKTELKIKATSEGFAKLRQESGQLNASLKAGAKAAREGFQDAEASVDDFAKALKDIERSVSRSFGGIAKEIRDVVKEMRGLQKETVRSSRQSMAQGGFTQGLAQGMGAGEFIQRGPGMGRQIGGRMVGRAIMAGPRAAAGGAFSGVSGFAQGFASIPGGGFMSAAMMNGVGMAEQALAYQRAQFSNLPTLGGMALANQAGAARRSGSIQAAGAAAGRKAYFGRVNDADVQSRMEADYFGRVDASGRGALGAMGRNAMSTNIADISQRNLSEHNYRTQVIKDNGGLWEMKEQTRWTIAQERGSKAAQTATRQAQSRAAQQVKNAFYKPIRQAGSTYGVMDATTSEAFAAQLGAAGGTSDPRSMMASATAAQTMFGVGAGTSGAFLQAQRRGGMVGPGGEEGLVKTLSEGLKLGLNEAEMGQWMEMAATGIQNFQNTGIPLAIGSIGGIAKAVSALGVGATRGQRIAQGITSAGQRLAQTGPQSAMDVMMLQQAGFAGGGTESLMNAMIELEQGMSGPQSTDMMKKLVQAGGGGAGGVFTLQKGLKRLGVNVGLGESRDIAAELQGGQPGSSERIQAILAEQKSGGAGAPTSAKGLQDMAQTMVSEFGPQLRRQAKLTNEQLGVGKGLLDATQDLKESTTNTAKLFKEQMGPAFELSTKGILTLTTKLDELIKSLTPKGLAQTAIDAVLE